MDDPGYDAYRPIAVGGWPRVLFYLLQFTWGLSVNLVGLLLFLCRRGYGRGERFCNSIVTPLPGAGGGFSLGIFIFLGKDVRRDLRAHEYGHTIQCLFLGPLYWIVIALPSVIWFLFFENYRRKHRVPYDALYCERWATSLGTRWSGR